MDNPATPVVPPQVTITTVGETQPSQEELDSDLINIAKKRMQLSKEYTQPYFDRFLDNYKHYFLRTIDEAIEQDPEAYPFYSNMMIPMSYQIVETIIPRMFSRLPTFTIKTEEQNDEMAELGLKELIRYQMNHPYLIDDPIYSRITTGLKEEFITGNCWGEVPWYMKEVEVVEWQPICPSLGLNDPSWDNMEQIIQFGGKLEWKLVKIKKRVIDAPVYENKSIFHVFPDPKKKRVSDLGWVIDEDFLTKEQIFDMANAAPRYFKNMDKFGELKPGVVENSGGKDTNYDESIANMFKSKDFTYRDDTQGQYKVWTMKQRDKMCIIINESLVIREGDNPNGDGKLGLILMKDIPIPHELYAWGEPDPIKKIEDAMSDQSNMRNDGVFYDLMRMWKLNPNSLVEGEEFVPEPGTVVQMNDLNGLEPLETSTTKASVYREYNEWEKIIQNVSGATDYATGAADPSMNKTQGGTELLQQAANARFAQKLYLFENVGLKAIGTMYATRNMRFFDTPQNLSTEKGKIIVTPDDVRKIRGNIHFIVDSGSTEAASKQTEIKKWDMLTDKLGKPPFANLSQKAEDEWGKRLLRALDEDNVEPLMEHAQPQVTQQVDPSTGEVINTPVTPKGQVTTPPAPAVGQTPEVTPGVVPTAPVAEQNGTTQQSTPTV